jgi:lipoprotein-releasing system permease protein
MIFELSVARRYLRMKQGAGFAYAVNLFSLIGIALGVATLIIVTSVMNGFREELFGKMIGMKGDISVISSNSRKINSYESIVKEISDLQCGSSKVIPIIEKQVVMFRNGEGIGIIVQGLSKNGLISKNTISDGIKKLDGFVGDSVFIGKRMSESLNLSIGDYVNLTVPDGLMTPFGTLPKQSEFIVSGIFEVGMYEYDSNMILMPLDTAQNFFGLKNSVTKIEIFLGKNHDPNTVCEKLEEKFDNLRFLNWQETDSGIFHAVKVEKNVMRIILGIIVLVAVFNIISGLTMLTNSKRREIGILRTIGVSSGSIVRIFFFVGSSIGIIGTVLGASFGLLVSYNIEKIQRFLEKTLDTELFSEEVYFLSNLPSKIDYSEFIVITIGSIILCLLATIYPSKKASGLDPVECIR